MEDKYKTCYIYERVSTEDQKYSIGNQSLACEDYARREGYLVLEQFTEDGRSGRTVDRPEFQRMLKKIEEHPVDAIITYKIDRFARNVGDFNNIRKQFKKKDIKLLSVNEGDVTEGLIGNIFASVAEWESDVISQRTKDGMTQKFRLGLWPSGAPHGYKNIKDENDTNTLVVDWDRARLIQWAFKRYSTGRYSIFKLSKVLHKKGFKTRNGKPLANSTIHQILTNPFYYGLMQWSGKELMGKHETLISKELFDLCQLVAAKHRDFLTRERKHDFLLRSFIFCARCGHRYTAEYHYAPKKLAKRGGKIAYYHCAKRTPCASPYVETEELEKKVAKHLKGIKFTQAFTEALTHKIKLYLENRDSEETAERLGYMNKRQALIGKRKILENRLYDDTIDRETFKRLHDELQNDINNLDVEMSKLEGNRKFDFDLLEEILSLTRNIPKTYKEAPKFLKKAYLNFFFAKIMIDNKKIVGTEFSPLIKELIEQKSVILRKTWLPRVDSNHGPIAYKNPKVS